MRLTALTPMLYTLQLEASISFYQDILGFRCGEKSETWGWASLYRDDVEIMLAKPTAHPAFGEPNFTGSFYFRTNDVAALWEELKDKVQVIYPMEDFEWNMREFAISDNNGYVLQFGQEIGWVKKM